MKKNISIFAMFAAVMIFAGCGGCCGGCGDKKPATKKEKSEKVVKKSGDEGKDLKKKDTQKKDLNKTDAHKDKAGSKNEKKSVKKSAALHTIKKDAGL